MTNLPDHPASNEHPNKPGEVATIKVRTPTNDDVEISVPKDIEPGVFNQVVDIAYWIQVFKQTTPTAELILKHPKCPDINAKKLRKIMGSAAYAKSAEVMGFTLPVGSRTLTEQQELALLVLTDPSIRGGFNQRLKVAGIGIAQHRAWMSDPLYRERIEDFGARLLRDHEVDMLTELSSQALSGDLQAIKYAFEVSGKHNPAQQAKIDVDIVLEKVVEIIASEVKDQDTLERIGLRLFALKPGMGTPSNKEITSGGEYPEIGAS